MGLFDHDEVKQLKRIADGIWELVHIFRKEQHNHIVNFTLVQINRGVSMPITGTPVGGTSTFQIGFVPPTNFIPLPSPPTVSADDPLVSLGPVDAVTFQFTATVGSTDTGTSYNITVAGVNDQGVNISHQFNIPIIPVVTPPSSITDFTLDQVS